MRILVINPNTMPEMTALVGRVIEPYLPPQATLVPVTGRFGARTCWNGQRARGGYLHAQAARLADIG